MKYGSATAGEEDQTLSQIDSDVDHAQSLQMMSRPHIVAVIPRGEVIRNFVYTGAFDRVSESVTLSLLSVSANPDTDKLLQSRYGELTELLELKESRLVGTLRELLDMAHGRWLWSEAARERWRLRDQESTTPTLKVKRLAKKLMCWPFANRPGLRFLSALERTSSRWLRTTDHYLQLFGNLKPTLVFNGSHVHSRIATPAVQAAQWMGIPTATFIFSWDNLTSQGRIMLPYDYYLVWSELLKKQLLELYDNIKPGQVFVTGTPQFDFHFRREFYWTREQFCESVGADASCPIVLYSTGMANHMPGEPDIVEGIADMLKEMTEFGPPQLMVRVYPKDRTGRFDELERRRPDILFPRVPWEATWLTPKFEDSYLLTNTIRHAAIGINVASTVSLELCMFDKPTLNVGYNPAGVSEDELSYRRYYDFDHYRPVVASGAVKVAYSVDEMRKMLRQALAHPEEGSENRKALLERMFGGYLDGRSGERVATKLLELAKA